MGRAIGRPVKNIAGQRFGFLTVGEIAGRNRQGNVLWECRCDCGNYTTAVSFLLTKGLTKSCGCYRASRLKGLNLRHGHAANGIITKTYETWSNMKKRCSLKTDTAYKSYGGRGITVCKRWRKFENFLADMGEKPAGLTLDRFPNNNGNYEPGNCRWATMKQQQNNKRTTLRIKYKGEMRPVANVIEELGLERYRVYARLSRGWSVERALSA